MRIEIETKEKWITQEQQQEITETKIGNQIETQVNEDSELSQAVNHIFTDQPEPNRRVSTIDKIANLQDIEITGILGWDTIIGLKIIPQHASFLTNQKKRLSISKDALGRRNVVDMTTGQRQHHADTDGGAKGYLKGLFKKRNPEQQ